MAKTKIEIIEIDLGIDIEAEIEKASKNISSETKKAIEDTVAEIQEKNKEKEEKKKQKDQKNSSLNSCIEVLLESDKTSPISSDKLLEIGESDKLSPLILRISNKLKKDGTGKVQKIKIEKTTHYYIMRDDT
jgi:hypothetical protein